MIATMAAGVCYEFVLGMLACDAYVRYSARPMPSQFSTYALLVGTLLMTVGYYLMHQPWFPLAGHMIISFGLPSVLVGFLVARKPVRWLETWPLQLLGSCATASMRGMEL